MNQISRKKRRLSLTGKIFAVTVLLLVIGAIGFGCVKGLTAIGWSGGVVSDDTIYLGTQEGRLVAFNLTDESRLSAEKISAGSSGGGLFGCIPAGGGCAGGAGVAIYGTPYFTDELVYIAGYNGKVYAYNKENLATRWVYPREGYLEPIVGGVVVSDGRLYFGGSDGYVYALDAETGDFLWEADTRSEDYKRDKIWATPAIADGTMYIGSTNKVFYAFNTADGSRKWVFPTEGAVTATPLVVDGTVYIGSHDRYLYALNAADGTLKWKFMAENWFWAKPLLHDGKIYAACLDGKVYVLDAATGSKLNEFDLEEPLASDPVMHDDNVIFCTREGAIYSINTAQNSLRQLAVIDEGKVEINGPLAIHDGVIYIHTSDLLLRRVNAETGAILSSLVLSFGE
ncbi:MAG TPA: PQQ-binding-like beta-propeller repeat protein [Dehalococcoidia bacterium]|nr:PQQ-binding-like beta-propeller repeat protein [Dehalococcoidia bacterium]